MRRLKVLAPSPLPPLYDAWMSELLGGPIAPETDWGTWHRKERAF